MGALHFYQPGPKLHESGGRASQVALGGLVGCNVGA